MATVALNLIVKDEYEQVNDIISGKINEFGNRVGGAWPYFDEINIVVSDKPTCNKLKKELTHPRFNIKWREWTDRFDEARNAVAAMNTTDYFFWVDADDTFDFSTIPELLNIAVENNLDEIFLPYNYAQDDKGNCIAKHYRERLVKCGRGVWKGWVHETYIIDEPKKSHVMHSPEVRHVIEADHAERSTERNHSILAKAYEATKDPRYLMYLGGSFFALGEYEKCIALLLDFIPLSGNRDDIYRSLCFISESAYHLENYPLAFEYATKAMSHTSSYPMSYWLMAQYNADQNQWGEALEWVRVSVSKPDPKTLTVWDPTGRDRAVLVAAQAEFMLGNFNSALAWLREIPENAHAQDLMEGFMEEADAETFTKLLPNISKFFYNDESLYEALNDDMRYDKRLQSFRFKVTKPRKWDDNSIVIFCGEGYEEWGPNTLDKGMGGSEEAVIYLARQLAMRGWQVTVFGETDYVDTGCSSGKDGGWHQGCKKHEYEVRYRQWKEIDTRDEFNVFISWRAPQYLAPINAKVKLVDIHDVISPEAILDDPSVVNMVKSQYHANLFTKEKPEADVRIVGNGIVKEQFHGRK